MRSARILPSADEDLEEIWNYIAPDNPEAAYRVVGHLLDCCDLLAENPFMGPLREQLSPNLRSFSVGKYLIFYRAIADGVEVVRILSGWREILPDFFD